MRDIWRDLQVAARRLRHSPGFALTVILSLTMAMAANLVVFGVFRTAVARPMGVQHESRLWMVVQKPHGYITQSYPDYRDYEARNSTFSEMAAYRIDQEGVGVRGHVHMAWDYEVTGNYFDMLGVRPELGQFFHAVQMHGANSAPYVVLSDHYWRSQFNADPGVVGSTVELNRHPFTVIGVAPPTFHGTELFMWPDFWFPIVNAPEVNGYSYLNERVNHVLEVIGMLKPGVTVAQAAKNLNSVAAGLAREYPMTDSEMGARLVRPGLLGDALGNTAVQFVAGILLLALLVLLAACVNLASIFAARATDRTRELAIRVAIGSSRWRVLRQVLAEAVLLSAIGGAAGTLVSVELLRWLSEWRPIAEYPIHVTVTAHAGVYAMAILLAFLSGILPALLTTRQVFKIHPMQAMKSGNSHAIFRKLNLRDVLLGVQVALCALLITSSLIGLRGMSRSLHAPLGFNPQHAMLAQTSMKFAGYSDASALPVQKRMIEEASQIPGVTAVGVVDTLPMNGGEDTTSVYGATTRSFRNSNSVASARFFEISPGYLKAAGTHLLAGRSFTWHDDAHAPKVAIINQTLAHILFGNAPAVGRYFAEPGPALYRVVGVVEDGKYDSITENPQAAMYWPLAQSNDNNTTLVVRSNLSDAGIAKVLSGMMAKIDPSLPVTIESWPSALALALFPARVASVALSVLGLLAGMLAITGIFGMTSYAVARRLREMGIRAALGAQRLQILQTALGRVGGILVLGSVAGLLLGAVASRVLASIVYDASIYDPVVVAGAVGTMLLIGVISALVPAKRAWQVDPARLLRED